MKANRSFKDFKNDKHGYMSPSAIIGVLGCLIVLAVAIYAFFLTTDMIPAESGSQAEQAINNTTDVGNTVFNIIGAVISIGAIMALIGVIMGAFRS